MMYCGSFIAMIMYGVYDGSKFALFCIFFGNIFTFMSSLIVGTSIVGLPCIDVHGNNQRWAPAFIVGILTALSSIYFWVATIISFCVIPKEAIPLTFCASVYSLFFVISTIGMIAGCITQKRNAASVNIV